MTLAIRDARWILGGWTYVPSMEPELEFRWDSRRHQLDLPTWRRKDELPVQIMTHPELVTLTAALAPNYTDPNYFNKTDFQLKKFNEHLRSSLGLPALLITSGDPVRAFIRLIKNNRARWRDPKTAMITETATPASVQ